MSRTYRFGYGTTRLTLAEMETKWTWAQVHPELRRRLVRMFDHHPTGNLGCGGGARDAVAQDIEFRRRHFVSSSGTIRYVGLTWQRYSWAAPFAPPGSSNHEDNILDGYALAVDVVGWEDHWFDANCHLYGLKNFGGAVGPNVNGEEWHAQVAEMANSRSAVNTQIAAGKRLSTWPLPGDVTQPTGDDVEAIAPIRLFDKRVSAGQPVLVPCPATGTVFVNITVADAAGDGWVSSGGDTTGASIVNLQPGLANSCCVPVGSLGGFYLTATTACRLIVDMFGKGS